MGVQLTPGQKCILDLLQRKLLCTIEAYGKLSSERLGFEKQFLATKGASFSNLDLGAKKCDKRNLVLEDNLGKQMSDYNYELCKLQAKIKRISARQKRFTSEILSGKGINTIPKEIYFKALGLITKEQLDKINLKSGERRRRTTANPRFSHEAIQAKKALEHHNSQISSQLSTRSSNRIEDRVARGLTSRVVATDKNNNGNSNTNNRKGRDKSTEQGGTKAVNNSKLATNNNNNSNNNNYNPQAAGKNANGRSNGRKRSKVANNTDKLQTKSVNNINSKNCNNTSSSDSIKTGSKSDLFEGVVTNCLSEHEKKQLQEQFELLQQQIFSRINQISDKRTSNRRLAEENDIIRKRGLDMMSALNEFCQNQNKAKYSDLTGKSDEQVLDMPLNLAKSNSNLALVVSSAGTNSIASCNGKQQQQQEPFEPYDLWLNLKCDESLEGIEASDNPCER